MVTKESEKMRKQKSILSKIFMLGLTMIFALSLFVTTAYALTTSPHRIAGQDRYATAAAIAQEGWAQSNYAILAFGENYPDALSAAPLARKLDAPILLTESISLTDITKQALL
ncbi:MAG: cell wall-binding repeat-containing protein, partial [Desulfitobacteriaceae bacterium]